MNLLPQRFAGVSEPPSAAAPRPYVVRGDGSVLGAPEGQFLFAYPRVAIDSNDVVHLLWAEPDSFPTDGVVYALDLAKTTFTSLRSWPST
ncbi:MAG TPA: hypothetical protein VFK04_08530 [Gemmatimonadaceae bacterium]|nr:hypothetical protein [Gemmatimonadaceae bacterium]